MGLQVSQISEISNPKIRELKATRVIDDIAWVKSTVNRRLAKGHGFYLQHAKETCIVGKKVHIFFGPNILGQILSQNHRQYAQY